MSGVLGMNEWEKEMEAGRSHIARLLSEEQEYQERFDRKETVSEAPVMPFWYYKGKRLNEVPEQYLENLYDQDFLNDYPDCKEWVEKNIINQK